MKDYSKTEVAIAVSDFPDPYANGYLNEEFVGKCTIDGEEYEQYASYRVIASSPSGGGESFLTG